jgi:hypothetical protein
MRQTRLVRAGGSGAAAASITGEVYDRQKARLAAHN